LNLFAKIRAMIKLFFSERADLPGEQPALARLLALHHSWAADEMDAAIEASDTLSSKWARQKWVNGGSSAWKPMAGSKRVRESGVIETGVRESGRRPRSFEELIGGLQDGCESVRGLQLDGRRKKACEPQGLVLVLRNAS
jgi:hypothetical protein